MLSVQHVKLARTLIASCASVIWLILMPSLSWGTEVEKPLVMTEIVSGTFVHEGEYQVAAASNGGAIANISFVVGERGVAVIDSGGSMKEGLQLKAAIRSRTDKPILYVINTHMHPDHLLGNAAFAGEAEFVGHIKLARALDARAAFYLDRARASLTPDDFSGTAVIKPTITVATALDLDLGGRILHVTAHPTAHTDNDLTVLDEQTGTIFTGDLLFVRHTPALDGSVKGWLEVIQALKAQPALRAVPGHGPPSVPWPQALEPQERYLVRLRDDIKTALGSGVTIGEAAKTAGVSERDAWDLFDEFNARNVSAAYAEMEWE